VAEVFEADDRIGGQLLTAGSAPHRGGWLRLLDYYRRMLDGTPIHFGRRVGPEDLFDFDDVIVATGAQEREYLGAVASSTAIRDGVDGLGGAESVLVADDGSNGWSTVSAVESAVAASCRVLVITPASGFAAAIPAESRVQLLKRLRGAEVELWPLTSLRALGLGTATVRNSLSGAEWDVQTDRVIVVGERIAWPWAQFRSCPAHVQVVGDALVPRKIGHALAEGRAAAAAVIARNSNRRKT
jgi:2,4-dienoyl-CoA reductase (NADPH2)